MDFLLNKGKEKTTAHPVEWVLGGVATLEYDDATFDVVLSHQALQYIADPLVAMNAMAPVTKAGGLKPGVAGIVRIGATHAAVAALLSISACAPPPDAAERSGPRWLVGDHHIHSRYSVGWNRATDLPAPIVAGDAIYPIPMNALMARHYGLGWMVATDHGGPNHSKVNLERAYPELVQSREVVPEIIQFFGMEFDTPGAEHSSLIIPHTHDEADRLHQIESSYATREPWPPDPGWDTPPRMLEALAAIRDFPASPVVIANHPSRSATDLGVYGRNSPSQLRDWNDAAPEVAVGMAGAPGHQASTLNPDGTLDPGRPRGGYGRYPNTHGREARAARLYFASLLPRRTPLRISTEPFAEYRETSSVGRVLPWFADGPLLASSPRRKSSGVSKAIAIWALSFTRLEANRNLLTAMSLLPKSIHRCRRYPTKFNSGRDIP